MAFELEKVLEIDPQVDLDYNERQEEVVVKGCTEKTVYPIGASTYTDANMGFQNISPASLTTVTDREFRIKYSLYVAVSFPDTANANYPFTQAIAGSGVARVWPLAAGGDNPAVAPAYAPGQMCYDPAGSSWAGANAGNSTTTFCLRAFPLQSTLSSLELFLNGQSVSVPQNDLICLQPYVMTDEEAQYATTYPVQRDNSALYKSPSTTDSRNPLSQYSQNTATQSRGAFMPTLVYEARTAGGANPIFRVYRYDLCESLCISPLIWANVDDKEGLANIVNISMNLTMQNLKRAFSRVAGLVVNSTFEVHLANFTFNGENFSAIAPEFIPMYLSQDPVLSARQGSNIFYNFDRLLVDANSNAITTPVNPALATGSWNGNALRSNIIPDEILVYIKPRKGLCDETTPDNFLRITKLQLSIGNRSNVFASYKEEDLWRMSCKNGIRLSWHEWQYTVGSIIKINIAKDVGLVSDEASGVTKFTMIKIDGTYSTGNLAYCVAANGVSYDVMTVLVCNGKAIVSPGAVQYVVGGLNPASVVALTSAKDSVIKADVHKAIDASGSGMFGSVGKLLSKGASALKSVATPENLSKLNSALDVASSGMSSLGIGGAVAGGKLRKHKRVL